jgi:hypothetical protein
MNWRIWLVVCISVLAVAAAILIPAIPQPLAYHDFADARAMFGIPNFLNVASNIAFLVVGIAGLVVTLGPRARFQFRVERWPYVIFFVGVLCTAAGSTYYHLAPNNERLFWDRLPMTVAFMGLVSAQIVDRISIRAGLVLLLPMLAVGVASVVYWRLTERAGVGNVVPYGILQGYCIVILLLMTASMPSRYSHGNSLYWVFAWYILSKIFETYDAEVQRLIHVVSGHTLKHLAAAIAGVPICLMLTRRSLVATASGPVARATDAVKPYTRPGAG